ncbi:ankyrin [Anaeromyces robustus]|uniref:Ankyrin n=1 Tax=Anaeromyces robustus TaxID=1754192 RepID=A0A1Y1X5V9_9FUNG|nr:ankyrin [Anaeromyces robustus]|eukprot:ORX80684.1 ankyrin [Anaeromyces robustus]
MVAYTNHQIEIFKYLLDYGANYNIKNKNGVEPNYYEQGYKQIPLVTLIKLNNDNNNNNNNNNENNNNINNINNINNYYYSIEDKIKIMDQLIEKGSDVNFIDNSRNTPLIYAILENSLTEAEFLIKKGANVNYISSYGDSPLVHAIHKRNLSMVKLLIEYGADINFYIENKHYSLLMYAIDLEAIDIVKYLIDKNVEINFSNLNDFYEFLEILNHNNHSNNNSNSNNTTTTATTTTTTTTTTTNNNNKKEIFEYIVQHRGDLFTCNIIGEIISLNRFDLIKILIENQININIRDDQGNIPLSYGIKFNERLIVNYLIEHGANIYNVNHSGQTIYELCCECYDLNNDHSISIYNKIKRLIQKDDHNSKKN